MLFRNAVFLAPDIFAISLQEALAEAGVLVPYTQLLQVSPVWWLISVFQFDLTLECLVWF